MTFDFLPAGLFGTDLLIALGIGIAAGLMRGFAGFGSAMMLSPIYAILYGPAEMVAMITLMELGISVGLVRGAMRDVEWHFVGPLTVTACLFLPLGAYILVSVDQALLTRVIAGIVLAFVLLMITGWRYQGRKRLPVTVALGAISGTMIATTSMGGPPVLAYMLSGPDKAATNRANIIMYFALTELVLLGLLIFKDLVHVETFWRAVILTPAYLAAGALGARQFRQASEQLYRRVAFTVLLLIAIFGLIR
jgi:uncharacterized membrane protein YfcA